MRRRIFGDEGVACVSQHKVTRGGYGRDTSDTQQDSERDGEPESQRRDPQVKRAVAR